MEKGNDDVVIDADIPIPDALGGGKIPIKMRFKKNWKNIALIVGGILVGLGIGVVIW